MADTLTNEQHDWATRFCHLNIKDDRGSAPGGGPGAPHTGKVVRVEYDPGKFKRKPPGAGAYSEAEYSDWLSHHRNKKDQTFPLTIGKNRERIVDPNSTPRALWQRRFYYARMNEDKDSGTVWEIWCNDDGDGTEADVYVKVPSS